MMRLEKGPNKVSSARVLHRNGAVPCFYVRNAADLDHMKGNRSHESMINACRGPAYLLNRAQRPVE